MGVRFSEYGVYVRNCHLKEARTLRGLKGDLYIVLASKTLLILYQVTLR